MAAEGTSTIMSHCKHKEKRTETNTRPDSESDSILAATFYFDFIFPEVAGTLLMIDNTVLNSPSQKCNRQCKEDNGCVLALCFTSLHSSGLLNRNPEESDLGWWILGVLRLAAVRRPRFLKNHRAW